MSAPAATPLTSRLTEAALGFQRELELDPTRPDALVGMSLVAIATQQPQAAVQMAQAAVTAAPRFGVAWVTLGQALKSAGRLDHAEHAYLETVALDGMSELARLGLGELRLSTGDPAQALAEFDLALRRDPALPAAHLGMGRALACLGRHAEALASYERALMFAPQLPEAEFAAAYVLARLGRTLEAETRYLRAIALRPDFAAAWMNLGCLLREDGREALAQAALERSVALRADMIAGWINLALLKREQRRPDQAETHLRKALAIDPDNTNTLIAWSQLRSAESDLDGAWEWLRKALAREPAHAEAVNMKGILLHTEERFTEAVDAFLRAESLGCLAAASNRGNSLMDLGRYAESLDAHRAAAARDPHNPGTSYNLALTELRLGDWRNGWPRYESRLRFHEVARTPMVFRQPRWQGEPLEGRRILLHAEQGLGDTIQFCRYAPLVTARGGRLVLQVHEPAMRLVESLAVVRNGQARVAQLGIEPPTFDLECPLMSLPAVFGTTPETVPWAGAYLAAEPALIDARRAHLACSELRVGIAWAGNPRYRADYRRSMRLPTLVPLLRTPGITWISLQKGEAALQLAQLPPDVCVHDGSSRDRDLAETAALVATLDLVITTDTSIAHLAGAMGKSVWILLAHLADWRWMQRVETTPWYPTARLFRQQKSGDWNGVLKRVSEQLRLLEHRREPRALDAPAA
jgi:tetratricopeptide (TPR) repeat protein